MSDPESILVVMSEKGRAINALRRRVAITVTDIILDRMIYGYQLGGELAGPTFEVSEGIKDMAPIISPSDAMKHLFRNPRSFTSSIYGALKPELYQPVSSEDVEAEIDGQYLIDLPRELNFEPGQDRRGTFPISDEKNRHPVDWNRPASNAYETMPCLRSLRDHHSPYHSALGRIGRLAHETWNTLSSQREVIFTEIADDVVRRSGLSNPEPGDAMIIRDVLRDLALFGLCARYKNKAGKTVFVLS